jgi:DNA-binding HxlR family transcriptional regulator
MTDTSTFAFEASILQNLKFRRDDNLTAPATVDCARAGSRRRLGSVTARTMNEVHGKTCAVAVTAELIAAKWTAIIVHDLSEGPRRFTQLEHACPGISPRTLSERLQMLEHEGIVRRHSYPESPPRVEYALTDKGRALLPVLEEMRRFGRSWLLGTSPKRRRALVGSSAQS